MHKAFSYIMHNGYPMLTQCSFESKKNKLDCYIGKDCLENFCKDLGKHAMKIINCEKKK